MHVRMRRSHLIHFSIERPVDEVYAFLADPRNYAKWAAVDGPMMRGSASDWFIQTPFGRRIVRFSEPNAFGVLDHSVFAEGEEPVVMPMRVAANGDGTELTFIFYQRDTMTDEQFASTIEWVQTDLLTLRSLLESPTSIRKNR